MDEGSFVDAGKGPLPLKIRNGPLMQTHSGPRPRSRARARNLGMPSRTALQTLCFITLFGVVIFLAMYLQHFPLSAKVFGTVVAAPGEAYLLEILEAPIELRDHGVIIANRDWVALAKIVINDVQSGDFLRIRGQLTFTSGTGKEDVPDGNGTVDPVKGHGQVFVDGRALGTISSENCFPTDPKFTSDPRHYAGHHCPLWTDAQYILPPGNTDFVELKFKATRSGKNPSVAIAPDGHLVVEHYRSFSSVREAVSGKALGLVASAVTRSPSFYGFGGAIVRGKPIYTVTIEGHSGDLVRVYGELPIGLNVVDLRC